MPRKQRVEAAFKLYKSNSRIVVGFKMGGGVALKSNPAICIGQLISRPDPGVSLAVVRPLKGGDTKTIRFSELVVWTGEQE